MRFNNNCNRCTDLIEAADKMTDTPMRSFALRDDIRRAAVLLAHAGLEDLLRSLAEIRLPHREATWLRSIPLVVDEAASKGAKYDLGDLAAYRGEQVSEVIRRSVVASLLKATYNDVAQVGNALDQIGLRRDLMEPYGGDLAAMMNRRHHIAHRADRNEDRREGEPMLQTIDSAVVSSWLDAVVGLGGAIINTLSAACP